MSEWQVIPSAEMPAVFAAMKDHRCVTCYGPIAPNHCGFYCCACDDDDCGHE